MACISNGFMESRTRYKGGWDKPCKSSSIQMRTHQPDGYVRWSLSGSSYHISLWNVASYQFCKVIFVGLYNVKGILKEIAFRWKQFTEIFFKREKFWEKSTKSNTKYSEIRQSCTCSLLRNILVCGRVENVRLGRFHYLRMEGRTDGQADRRMDRWTLLWKGMWRRKT